MTQKTETDIDTERLGYPNLDWDTPIWIGISQTGLSNLD
jgi:hypothetical protein